MVYLLKYMLEKTFNTRTSYRVSTFKVCLIQGLQDIVKGYN